MSHDLDSTTNRRDFLKFSGRAAATGLTLPWVLNLAAMGEAAAFNGGAAVSDYKALVCVFLYGGNDYANTVVTYDDSSYTKYSTIRGGTAGIALSKDGFTNGAGVVQPPLSATLLNPASAPADVLGVSRQYALNPAMTGLAGLFNAGHASVVLNVGPLVKPLNKAQYASTDWTTNPRPPQLFSHNDQQSVWQSSSAEGSKIGWGGKIGDRVIGHTSTVNTPSLFTCMSVTGNAVLLSGSTALQYQVGTGGAIKINAATNASVFGSSTLSATISSLIRDTARSHKLEKDYNTVTDRAMTAESIVTSALNLTNAANATPPGTPLSVSFPTGNSLSDQLKIVARLIKGRSVLGAQRQVFLVSIGGFDLHDNLIRDHGGLLGKVSDAMSAFYDAIAAPDINLADKVTAFTASDFGRTLASNGDGSDHGWGSHHLIVGGAVNGVNGKKFYGTPPPVSVGSTSSNEDQWHVGQGRLLPTTSVDQYAATLAKWFGVDDSEMTTVLPNIASYPTAGGFNLAWTGGTLNYPRYLF
jgi:uncharacterized protein (DUF1501 family)